MKIITRAEAKEQGLKRYFTGKPCKRWHVSERWVSTMHCIECKKAYREANRDIDKAYYEDNKEKIAEKSKNHYEANKEKLAERMKAYRENNKNKINERTKAYYEANKDKVAERVKAYREANKDKVAEREKAYHKANPLQKFTRDSLQRIEKAIGKDRINRAEVELGYTQDDFKQHIESLWLDGMSWDNRSEWHIDHIKPISLLVKEGITDPAIINALSNLQPLWAKDNLSKGAKYEVE